MKAGGCPVCPVLFVLLQIEIFFFFFGAQNPGFILSVVASKFKGENISTMCG